MKNFLSRPDELGRSFEQGMSSATSAVKNAAKTVAGDIKQQTKPQADDWLEALYGRSTSSAPTPQNAASPSSSGEMPPDPFTPAETKAIVADEQRGDKGVEALDPQKQHGQQQQQKHVQHHKTTYYEPLFGEERKKKLKQQQEQEAQVEENQDEQQKMEELQVKKQKDNEVVARSRRKVEAGIGNAGG